MPSRYLIHFFILFFNSSVAIKLFSKLITNIPSLMVTSIIALIDLFEYNYNVMSIKLIVKPKVALFRHSFIISRPNSFVFSYNFILFLSISFQIFSTVIFVNVSTTPNIINLDFTLILTFFK